MTDNLLARLVKRHRTLNKISQEDLARALGYSSRQHISNIERGGSCSPYMIAQIGKFLMVPEKELKEAFYDTHIQEANKVWTRIKAIMKYTRST
jgi:transcriptional regulator with XRE-family HTH domain